jgi:hypothetical protein
MLVDIWRSMISGSSIDDQRIFRPAITVSSKSEPAKAKPPAGDSDEERDPNDIVQTVTSRPTFADDPDSDDYSEDGEY